MDTDEIIERIASDVMNICSVEWLSTEECYFENEKFCCLDTALNLKDNGLESFVEELNAVTKELDELGFTLEDYSEATDAYFITSKERKNKISRSERYALCRDFSTLKEVQSFCEGIKICKALSLA